MVTLRLRGFHANAADQAVFALSNIVLTVAMARNSTVTEFGRLSLVYLAVILGGAIVRGALAESRATVAASAPQPVRGDLIRSLGVGAIISVVTLAVLAIGGYLSDTTAVVLAASGPALAACEFGRYVRHMRLEPQVALAGDSLWLTCQLLVVAGAALFDWGGALIHVVAWVAGCVLCAIVTLGSLLVNEPASGAANRWSWALAGDNFVSGLSPQLTAWALAVVGGTTDVANLRSVQTLLGPLGVVAVASRAFLLPRLSGATPSAARDLATRSTVALLVAGIVVTTVLVALPDEVGRFMFADSWSGAALLALGLGLGRTFAAGSVGFQAQLITSGRAAQVTRLRVALALSILAVVLAARPFLSLEQTVALLIIPNFLAWAMLGRNARSIDEARVEPATVDAR